MTAAGLTDDATRSWPQLLTALLRGADLGTADTAWAMAQIMAGEATQAQVAAFAVALRAKGETSAEVTGLAAAMLSFANPVPLVGESLDIVGSGADQSHTVNISTMAALVAAAAGARVTKHGNRAATSSCGAADVLEELGVAIDLAGDGVAACVEQVGIGFCFAPIFHPAFRHTAVPRREIGVRTVFNFLGPLTNPARPIAGAIGVADLRMAEVTAGVLAGRGNRALVFRGDDGLDELTTTTTSQVWVVAAGTVVHAEVDPARLGIPAASVADLRGADAKFNAGVVRELLAGKTGAVRDAVLLNASAGLAAFDGPRAVELDDQLVEGIERGAAAIDDGTVAALLARWITASQQARG
jgi:anthranilate phosphoribosyltransferase